MATARITNAVLQERQDQQHTQVMLTLARMEDKITTLCKRIQEAEIISAEDRARIAMLEKQQVMTGQDSKRMTRLVIAIALIASAMTATADRLIGLLIP